MPILDPDLRGVSRRQAFAVLAAGAFAASRRADADDLAAPAGLRLYQDVKAYDQLGEHRTATAADNACSLWLRKRLAQCGLDVELQSFSAPLFEPSVCRVETNDRALEAFPAWPVKPTPPEGVRGVLSAVGDKPLEEKIAFVKLAYTPSGAWTREHSEGVLRAIARKATAVVVATEGPTGGIIAFNPVGTRVEWPVPVVLIGASEGHRLANAVTTGSTISVMSTGAISSAPASNVIGRRGAGARTIIVSTPKSGWFHCAGERGSGIAMLLALAEWLPKATDRNLLFVATSGHELGELGAAEFLKQAAPSPSETELWLHIGANVAVQNVSFHGAPTGDGTAVKLRSLFASPDLGAAAQKAFAGVDGYSTPKTFGAASAPGELEKFRRAGYGTVAGIVGTGPLFHTRFDRADLATTPSILEPVLSGLRRFLSALP